MQMTSEDALELRRLYTKGSVRGSGGNSELLRVWAEVAIGSAG